MGQNKEHARIEQAVSGQDKPRSLGKDKSYRDNTWLARETGDRHIQLSAKNLLLE